MLVFYAKLEKDTTKSTPPRSNHVKPSALPRREDEALEANQQKKVDSASTIDLVSRYLDARRRPNIVRLHFLVHDVHHYPWHGTRKAAGKLPYILKSRAWSTRVVCHAASQ